MKNKIKVVMLPTEDTEESWSILLSKQLGTLSYYKISEEALKSDNTIQKHHIYITVSQDVEPIKESDWCIHLMQNDHDDLDTTHVFQAGVIGDCNGKKAINNTDKTFYFEYECRKIIATTDPKLKSTEHWKTPQRNGFIPGPIPQLQQSFLKEFVANFDGEYEVEYEDKINPSKLRRTPNSFTSVKGIDQTIFGLKLKLNKDNTVNITSVKNKMYTREEVEVLILNAVDDNAGNTRTAHHWIKNNL
jgi:hypothetical protein